MHHRLTLSAQADSLFPIVSAASICAKVTRDTELAHWKFSEKVQPDLDFGCGYPGDEKTKSWLLKNFDPVFGFSGLVRFSWQTTKRLLESNGACCLV